MSQHNSLGCVELANARTNYVAIEQFYVAIELARVGRISITIEDF